MRLSNTSFLSSTSQIQNLNPELRNEFLGKELKILILEDSESDLELIKTVLESSEFRFTPHWVTNQNDFITSLKKFKADLVLSDFSIPGFSGMEALKIVRNFNKNLPFILVTGSLGEEKAVETILQGANDFVLKHHIKNLPAAILRSLTVTQEKIKRSEANLQLRNSEARFRNLIEHSHDFILVIDQKDSIIYISPAVINRLGHIQNNINELNINELIHEDDVVLVKSAIQNLKDKKLGSIDVMQRWKLKEGDYRWMVSTISDHCDKEGINGFVYNIKDIHDFIIAKDQLVEKNILLDSIMNNIREGVIMVDDKGQILMSNQSAKEMLSIDKDIEELGSKWVNTIHLYMEKEINGELQELEFDHFPCNLVSKGRKVQNMELKMFNDISKTEIWIKLNARPVYDINVESNRYVISFGDITSRKHYESELHNTLNELENLVNQRTEELQVINQQLSAAHKRITYSINYAKRIQQTLTPTEERFNAVFPESFRINMPKDIVSGDFVWMHEEMNGCHLAVADCTGHGVPGAMMSMMGNDLLERIIVDRRIRRPEIALEELDEAVSSAMRVGMESQSLGDGMDLNLCYFNFEMKQLMYAGAYCLAIHASGSDINVLETNRIPIGGFWHNEVKEFNRTIVKYKTGDRFYFFTDGYQDQFGGEFNKKFSRKRVIELIRSIKNLNMKDQKQEFLKAHDNWRGENTQLDDITVVAVQL